MKKKTKKPYEQAEIETVSINDEDVITTSGDLGEGGDIDNEGWTNSNGW